MNPDVDSTYILHIFLLDVDSTIYLMYILHIDIYIYLHTYIYIYLYYTYIECYWEINTVIPKDDGGGEYYLIFLG